MKLIDPSVGPRSATYALYRGFASPWFTLCSPVRVDPKRLKAQGGLFGPLLHAVLAATVEVPELRRRIRVDADGKDFVVEHEKLDCTCTVARQDGSFAFGYFPYDPDLQGFLDAIPARIQAATSAPGLDMSQQGRDDMIYASCTPWMTVTGVVHAMHGDPLDCVPRILWSRIEDGKVHVCVSAHHSVVDGMHVARFLAALQDRIS